MAAHLRADEPPAPYRRREGGATASGGRPARLDWSPGFEGAPGARPGRRGSPGRARALRSLRVIDLRALRDKYREMKRLRAEHEAGEVADPRPAMRALAARFPGALREIDELPMHVIDARIASLERALAGEAPEPWVRALARYHAWMRLALRLRLACARDRSAEAARAWLAGAEREHADDVEPRELDEDMLAAVLRPPGGRLHRVILGRVGRELDVEPAAVDAHLRNPSRRR